MSLPTDYSPHIEITLQPNAATLRQHRPPVLPQLAGMGVEQALALVPSLLPICGAAQSIAAARAVEAARGVMPTPAVEDQRECALEREQALSCGWRLAVDWPDLLGESRELAWLKQLRAGTDPTATAALLHTALPGIAEVRSPDDLRAWANQRHCTASRLLDSTLAAAIDGDSHPLCGRELERTARRALDMPGEDNQPPATGMVEVGPLAMGRDCLVQQLERQQVYRAPARRTAALVLDCRQFPGERHASARMQTNAWLESDGSGTGRAFTARGPVFHRVALDSDDRVVHWRSLAPTDWHFAASGPLAAALAGTTGARQVRLLVAGFDPCVPCRITVAGEA